VGCDLRVQIQRNAELRGHLEDWAKLVGVHVPLSGPREKHGSDEPELGDRTFEFGGCGVRIRRWERGERGEPVGVLGNGVAQCVVRFACEGPRLTRR
jgi:hypothetical protein